MYKVDNFFFQALKEVDFPNPFGTKEKAFECNGFLRWGLKNRYSAKKLTYGYYFRDFAQDFTKFVPLKSNLSMSELRNTYNQIEREREELDRQQTLFHERIKEVVNSIWEKLPSLNYSHPYLVRKKAKYQGLKITGEHSVVIPIYDKFHTIWSLQFISESGVKHFYKGGKIKGCFYAFNKFNLINKRVFICEGYATGSSIAQAFPNDLVLTAFSCWNLLDVATEFLQINPKAQVIFCADNDLSAKSNVGLNTALRAAKEINGKCVYPSFLEHDNQSVDFNDLHCWYGLETVKQQIEGLL